ncbi:hypothetical protein BGI28_29140 [Burkholderia contaminans]|nr:hypothetical protein BGI28_29140 [Burkholderia contaminans]
MPSGYCRNSRARTSTPGKRKRCAVKRATSASVRRVRIGRLSKFFESSCSFLKRRRSRASIGMISDSLSIVLSSVSSSFDGVISSV